MYYLLGRPNVGNYTTIGRESGLDPVTWTEDDWFHVNLGKGPSVIQTAPDLTPVIYERRERDEFDQEKLGLEWKFVRNPDAGSWSLSQN